MSKCKSFYKIQDKKVDTEWLVEYNGDNKLLGFYKKIENFKAGNPVLY